jgi:post-segregation antitoxin (ccd killing protein)
MAKSITTLSIDEGLIKMLRARRINISGLVNDFLKTFVGETENDSLKQAQKDFLESQARFLMIKEKRELEKKIEKAKMEEEGIPFNLPCQ